MKKRTFLLATLVVLVSVLTAQTQKSKFAIGLHGGLNEYNGDLGNGLFKFKDINPLGALSISTFVSPSFDLGIQGSYGKYSFKATNQAYQGTSFLGNKAEGFMFLDYKLNNGYILPKDFRLSPFLSAGIGLAGYIESEDSRINTFPMDLITPIGGGLKYQISDNFALQYKYLYHFTNHDEHDLARMTGKNDAFAEHLFGLVVSIGADKVQERARHARGNSKSKSDWVDSDGDGVPDVDDKCPQVYGLKQNKGCPEVNEETMEIFRAALQGIQFDFDKATIKSSSYDILDKVVEIMNQNPVYNLEILGHTDNVGDDAYNKELSERRVEAVKQYLVNKGIDARRMKTYGFGESKPITTNETAKGRFENRRVEFNVVF